MMIRNQWEPAPTVPCISAFHSFNSTYSLFINITLEFIPDGTQTKYMKMIEGCVLLLCITILCADGRLDVKSIQIRRLLSDSDPTDRDGEPIGRIIETPPQNADVFECRRRWVFYKSGIKSSCESNQVCCSGPSKGFSEGNVGRCVRRDSCRPDTFFTIVSSRECDEYEYEKELMPRFTEYVDARMDGKAYAAMPNEFEVESGLYPDLQHLSEDRTVCTPWFFRRAVSDEKAAMKIAGRFGGKVVEIDIGAYNGWRNREPELQPNWPELAMRNIYDPEGFSGAHIVGATPVEGRTLKWYIPKQFIRVL